MKKLKTSNYTSDGVFDRIVNAWKRAGYDSAAEFSRATFAYAEKQNSPNVRGISTANITKWKNSGSTPNTDALITICNVCGCDMQYLLGAIDTFKFENESICDDIALSEKAVEKLRSYRLTDSKTRWDYLLASSSNQAAYVQHEKTIPLLISHLLTYSDANDDTELEKIVDEICKVNAVILEYTKTSAPIREICQRAYQVAQDKIDSRSLDYYEDLKREYQSYFDDNYKSIIHELGNEDNVTTELFEDAKNSFHIVHLYHNKEERDRIAFVITQRLYSLITSLQDNMISAINE